MSRWKVGEILVDRVLEFEMPTFQPSALFPASTPAAIEAHRHWLEPALMEPGTGLLILAFQSFVVRTPRHTILVDTCGGNHKPRPTRARYHMKNWPYLEQLGAAGYSPADIDVVFCTHLHVDHVGWNTRLENGRWVPTFPKARYLFGRRELEFWQQHFQGPDVAVEPHYEDSVLPILEAKQADLVEDGYSIEDGVSLTPTPGHTPGHLCLNMASRGRQAVVTGDLMHHALQCAEPDWSTCFCTDPDQAARTRRAFLEQHAETDTLIMPAHFPAPSVGRIVRAGTTWRFTFDGGL